MFPDARDAALDAQRVGLWLVRAGVIAGLLCLAAGGRAHASDSQTAPGDAAQELLLAPEFGADARVREAQDLLDTDRNRKVAFISSALVDLGINASIGAAPLKLLRSAGDLGRGVWNWSKRTRGEERALLLLAPGALGGDLDATTRELYEKLEGRERSSLASGLLDDASRALRSGQLRRARLAAERARQLDPSSQRAESLLTAIASRATAEQALASFDLEPVNESLQFQTWDVRLATSLLTDGDPRDPNTASDAATLGLAHATASYESGDRAAALSELRRVAELDGAAAGVAREVLEDRAINPERALDDEISSYNKRHYLGVLGGQDLADNGLTFEPANVSFSYEGFERIKRSYKVFRRTVNPVNLAIDAPARLWRDWRPDAAGLRDAATRYLELEPNGARADEAREWLETLRGDERASATVTPFRDGYFVLPKAHTRYERIAPSRVVVSREALERQAPELAAELADAPAFVLAESGLGEGATALPNERALELLGRLADGLESGSLQSRGQTSGEVLEAVRRLDARLRSGTTLHLAPRLPEVAATLSQMGTALVDGDKRAHTVGDIAISRQEEDIVAGRDLDGDGSYCLAETPCIDRKLSVDGQLFARTYGGDSAGVGVRAGYREARLSVEMGTSGPHASLILPIARWLGISHFLPVEAHVDVGLDGISASPRLDEKAAAAAEESL